MTSNSSAVKIAFFTIFLDLLGFGIIIPVQAFYAESFGATPVLVTLLGASYSLMQFCFTPFWGMLSDKYGRRPIILSSVAFAAVAYLIFGLATELWILFAARMLSGFGNANIATAQSIISDSTTSENRSRGMGLIGAAFGLGFIFGPAIGGVLGHFDPRYPSFCACALSVANWFFAYRFLPETKSSESAPSPDVRVFSIAAVRNACQVPGIAAIFTVTFLYTVSFACMEQIIGLFIQAVWIEPLTLAGFTRTAAATRLTAIFLVAVGITLTVVQGGLIGRLSKKFSEKVLIRTGLAIVGASLILLPFVGMTEYFWLFTVTGMLMSFGAGIINPSSNSLLSKLAAPNLRGSILGINQSCSAMGRVIGPACAGILFEIKPALPLWIGGAIMFVAWSRVQFLLEHKP